MKKIVGIMVVAAMASSMFAADVAARLKLGTKLYDSKSVLTKPESTGWDDNNTFMKMSVAGDKAGAEIHLSNEDVSLYGLSLWCKPVDAVKVVVGNQTVNSKVNGTFAWWAQSVKLENVAGVGAYINAGDLSVEVLSCNTPLLNFNNEGYAVVGDFWLGAAYNLGNAGTVSGFVTKGAAVNAYGVGGWKTGALTVGAAYNHMPWQQTGFYADAFVNFNGEFKFDEVGSQIGGQYCGNGLALRLTNMIAYGDKYGTTKFDYGFAAKASYAIDAYTPYLQLLGNEILGKKLSVEAGVDFNVGSCAINAAVSVPLNFADMGSTAVSVPVSFDLSF